MTVLWSYDETISYRKHALTYHNPHLYGSHMIPWWGYALQEACPYIPPTTSLCQSNDPMMRLCFTGSMPLHTTNHVFMTVLWTYDETMFYRKHALTYHQPHLYDSLMIQWWDYVLQEACPYIPLPHLYDSLMILWWGFVLQEAYPYIPLPNLNDSLIILWRGFVLQEAYPYIPLPHLYDSLMILWWDNVLQEAYPYKPPTTSLWQSYNHMMRLCFTGSMPLYTTTSSPWQSYDPMMRLCLTGSIPLHTSNHVFMTVL